MSGFSVVIGNPPWIAHAGRAAHPLPDGTRAICEFINPAFAGFRTTHGMIIRRAAELLRAGGTLGLIVPTSVADLDGYGPTRSAVDELCVVEDDLEQFGADVFPGVFQPCMSLVARRRNTPTKATDAVWNLHREDMSADDAAFLARLIALPPLDPKSFGERGLQTDKAMRASLTAVASTTHTIAVREGGTIREFTRLPVELFASPDDLCLWGIKQDDFTHIPVVLRQTARFPIAAVHDGTVFRNSLLAAFPISPWTPPALCAFLNSTLVRWHHYKRFRDARQGMPQVKIGHLRTIPAPPKSTEVAIRPLHEFGTLAMESNRELNPTERNDLDKIVATAFGLTPEEREVLLQWSRTMPK